MRGAAAVAQTDGSSSYLKDRAKTRGLWRIEVEEKE